jgi:hypothetical protein
MSLILSAIKWAPTQIDALPPAAANPDSVALDALQRKWWNTKWWKDQGFPNPDQPGGMQWRYLKHVAEEFGKIIADSWPLADKLRQMAAKSENGPGRWVGPHVAAVIASVNGTLGRSPASSRCSSCKRASRVGVGLDARGSHGRGNRRSGHRQPPLAGS